ncbi:MAG: SsrA-binding protein SmpB [Eubacteriales bacterium]|nr:SsrA-binding protein SmpB [Eubacteriales bacterium]
MAQEKIHKKTIARNRRARFDYEILERFEAGIVLTGTEIKSLRAGKASIADAYAKIANGEIFITGMDIPPYREGNRFNHPPLRERKLLLHKREIRRLSVGLEQEGLTIVPLELYFKNQYAKLEIALARGKKLYDKRQSERERSEQKAMREWQK